MGGRGSSSGVVASGGLVGGAIKVSPLTAFKENARQFNSALRDARRAKASIVEFKDVTGQTSKRYWNGATYTDRKSSLYEKEFKGTYKAKFKQPKDWE